MMWIVTFDASLSDDEFASRLTQAGGTPPETLYRIPLGNAEASVEIEAGAETVEKLREIPGILGVYPSSNMDLY